MTPEQVDIVKEMAKAQGKDVNDLIIKTYCPVCKDANGNYHIGYGIPPFTRCVLCGTVMNTYREPPDILKPWDMYRQITKGGE